MIPDYTRDEMQACRAAVKTGMYETGLIVDANNVIYRLAFAASKDVSDAAGMLQVFVDRVQATAKDIGADLVVCCMDYGVSLRRSMLGATKKPDKNPEQEAVIDLAREALKLLREPAPDQYKWFNPRWLDGYEADDLAAAFAVSQLCVHTVLYSTDSDLYQVTTGSGVVQMSPATGKFLVSEVPQPLVPGVKALSGDDSDSVVGLKHVPLRLNGTEQVGGVGPVTALKILRGDTVLDLPPDQTLRVRNNLTLTALPFPGSHQCLIGAEFVRVPSFDEHPTGDVDELESLPF